MPRILVVEDIEMVAQALARMLIRNGHEVDVAADGAEARRLLETTTYSVILADFGLPGGETGLDVLAHARVTHAQTARILMSASTMAGAGGKPPGWYTFLAKPFATERILKLITTLTPESSDV